MKYSCVISMFTLVMLGCLSCESSDEDYVAIETENRSLTFPQPDHFPEPSYNLSQNPPTEKGFELGKKLFYDGRLSETGVISCGFCHIQEFAFTHHTHQVSHGVNGALGQRNAQPLMNLAYQAEFSWDGAASHLDAFSIIPITTEFEMNESITHVIEKLKTDPHYQTLFNQAFENGEINPENMFKAISQFLVMMVSAESKYDRYLKQQVSLNTSEAEGLELFESKCASCHSGVLLTDQSYRNNGLAINPIYNDVGRERVTGYKSDRYKFKVPSLRNVAVSFPYMHDGRFQTLKDVLDHYDTGVTNTLNLDPIFEEETTLGIPLTEEEKSKIISFLSTLTDDNFLLNSQFSEF